MQLVNTQQALREQIDQWRKAGQSIGFVPTMGYLHAGHGSLIEQAKKQNDRVVVSVFVNPTQFGPTEDLSTYPRDLEADTALIASLGGDLLFHPDVTEMYPHYPDTGVTTVSVSGLGEHLCGAKRPGHFDGVCLVVTKLLNMVQPHRAYFGEKDYQQLAVIRHMVADLDLPVDIIGCPIMREPSGLALSSRNSYLTPEQKEEAAHIYGSLRFAQNVITNMGESDPKMLAFAIESVLERIPDAKIDYIQIVCPKTLTPVDKIEGQVLIALAVYVGKTRLIDNMLVEGSGQHRPHFAFDELIIV